MKCQICCQPIAGFRLQDDASHVGITHIKERVIPRDCSKSNLNQTSIQFHCEWVLLCIDEYIYIYRTVQLYWLISFSFYIFNIT